MTIPQWSGGEVPFARVAHAKFAIFDGRRAWIGTSNWEGDYFAKSRNVSVFIEGGAVPSRAQALFNEDFLGQYAAPLPGPSWPAERHSFRLERRIETAQLQCSQAGRAPGLD